MRVKVHVGTLMGLALALNGFAAALEAEPPQSPGVKAAPIGENKAVAAAVEKLAGQFKAHPAVPSKAKEGRVLYLLDAETGDATLIVDEPDEGLVYGGSPEWSQDGTRLLFDVTPAPGNAFDKSRLQLFEAGQKTPELSDLGPGNCPGLTPEGDRVIFLLNPGAVANAEPGTWIMQATGQNRRFLCEFGRPKISPDGKRLLIVSFADPTQLSLIDIKTGEPHQVSLAEPKIYTTPTWYGTGSDTLIAAVGDAESDSIALVDISKPEEAKIKKVLWKRGPELETRPVYPIYSPETDLCIFIGRPRSHDPAGTLYSFHPGRSEKPRPYERKGYGIALSDPIFSPGGRYVVFSSEKVQPPK
ncbi:TolB family protein [Singulisphaera sp. PoT]|uniref:TolB family protein n=1 Tax=Singulisphaera sp. PoT TaxID=3411797 RepID=UPI003BF53D16